MVSDLVPGWVNRTPGYPELTLSFFTERRVRMISLATVSTFERFLTVSLVRLVSKLKPNENLVVILTIRDLVCC